MRAWTTLALGVAACAAERTAAATPTARLVYSRTVDAASCPDEPALRRAVAARIGYDPFFPWAKKTIVAGMTSDGRGFVARVVLVDEAGIEHGARQLRTAGACRELLDPVALGIAIAIDARALTAQASTTERIEPAGSGGEPASDPGVAAAPDDAPADAPVSVPATAPSSAPSPSSAPRAAGAAPLAVEQAASPRTRMELAVGGAASVGVTARFTRVAWAPTVEVAAARGPFSLGLEVRVDLPSSEPVAQVPGAHVSSLLAVLSVLPCVRAGPLSVCGVAQSGIFHAWTDGVADARAQSAAFWAVGARLMGEAPLTRAFGLRGYGEAVANLRPETLNVAGSDVGSTSRVAATLGIGAVLHFR